MSSTLQTHFQSRLPKTGTTIFSQMSALAKQHDAVNLGQGFPDFACDPDLITQVNDAMREGHNQYPLMSGVAELRAAIAQKNHTLYGHRYNETDEITVTSGATQAIFTAISCVVHPGDEVIIIEPAYDSYIPAIRLAGGSVRTVPLAIERNGQGHVTSYRLPLEALAQTISKRTRLIVINTPHNPTGTVWNKQDLQKLEALLENTDILVCSDEVYEHIIFDGRQHESVARYPGLAARSFVISSFGKSFHVTGWKIGYVCAPAWLTAEFRKLHQYTVFTANSAMQYGIARYMTAKNAAQELPEFYQKKRDYFRQGLAKTPFKLLPCEGTYFQCVDYTALPLAHAKLNEQDFAEWLTREIGVAAIPVSAFYDTPTESGVIRFCFAKKERTLAVALERLGKLLA
jgi:methionine aminotransferase